MIAETTGRISGIKRAAVHDGDGLRTTVFCKGCPLRCVWCHNPEGLAFEPEVGFYRSRCIGCGGCARVCPAGAVRADGTTDRTRCTGCFACADACPADARVAYGREWKAGALAEKLLEDRAFFESGGGGVTISGGECLAQPAFTAALAELLAREGISVDIDTCGAVPREALDRVRPFTDVFLYDLKAIDPGVHRRCTGADNARILDNLRYLLETGSRVEIRYPYAPGWNDGECAGIGGFLQSLGFDGKIKVLGCHALADGKYAALALPDTLPDLHVGPEAVDEAVRILEGFGLHAVNGMRED